MTQHHTRLTATWPTWLSGALALGTILCSGMTRAAPPPDHPETVVVRVGTVAPPGTPWEAQLTRMQKRLQHDTGGTVKLKLYLGGQKGDEKSLVRQCRDGRLEMVGVSSAALATLVESLNVLELPGLFASSEEADFVLDDYLYRPVQEILARHEFVLLQWAENGWQSFGTKNGLIKSPADLVGLKMRSQEAPVHLMTWKALGAAPVEMAVSEVLPALKTGLVDGFAQTPLFTFAAGWHQGIQYFTVSDHVYQPALVVFSKRWFEQQTADVQKALTAGYEQETKAGRAGVRAIRGGLIQNFVQYGIKVHELTTQERAAFLQAGAAVTERYRRKASKEARRLLDLIDQGKQAYAKAHRTLAER